jgi:hypothetical protein
VCAGETRSEGGFAKNKVSSASLLDVQKAKDSKGKSYYKYEILSRSGTEFLPSFPARASKPALLPFHPAECLSQSNVAVFYLNQSIREMVIAT